MCRYIYTDSSKYLVMGPARRLAVDFTLLTRRKHAILHNGKQTKCTTLLICSVVWSQLSYFAEWLLVGRPVAMHPRLPALEPLEPLFRTNLVFSKGFCGGKTKRV